MANVKPQILVTGAAGALAQRLIRLLKQDYRVVGVDFRRRPELGRDIASYGIDLNHRGFEDIFRRHELAGVIHLGRILAYESSPYRRYNANVLGTRHLLDFCRQYRAAPVLVLSTFHVYGATPYNPAPLDEEAPLKASELTLDLVDSVELENLATVYRWRYPELNITILRPCHIVGPGMNNSMSLLLSQRVAPVLAGFSPLMQFIHVDDMAQAVRLAFQQNQPGIYNVAPQDWIPYQEALAECGCMRLPLPSIPALAPYLISRLLGWKSFPSYLLNYFKYPVIIDGGLFERTFGFQPRHSLATIFAEYRRRKEDHAGGQRMASRD